MLQAFNENNKTPLEEYPMSEKARKRMERRQNKNKNLHRSSSIVARNARQAELLDSLKTASQIFAIGEAGTGKTWLTSRIAMQLLKAGKIDKIYVSRPTVAAARHKQGFLPGKLEQKLAPWLIPVMEAFKDEVSANELDRYCKEGSVEFVSFEHMRGRTFKNAFVILDEAQNCTFGDLRMFLTRKGENCTYVVTGDPSQVDIPDSGLDTILDIIEEHDIDADIIEFLPEDVVRSVHAGEWVKAFSLWSGRS
jgi:phosphate starvation-inducible PhoH-like protein